MKNEKVAKRIYLGIVAVVCAVILFCMEFFVWNGLQVEYTCVFGYETATGEFVLTDTQLGGDVYGSKKQYLSLGGKTQSVTAAADSGFRFVGWTDGNTNPVRSDAVFSSHTYTAVFTYQYTEMPVLSVTVEEEIEMFVRKPAQLSTYCGKGIVTVEEPTQIRLTERNDAGKNGYEFTFSEEISLFGLRADDQWILYNMYYDYSLMRDYYSLTLAKILGFSYVSDATFVNVILNGKNIGVYLLCQGVDNGDETLIEHAREELVDGTGFVMDGNPYGIPSQFFNVPNGGSVSESKQKVYAMYDAVWFGTQEDIEQVLDVSSAVNMYLLQELCKNTFVGWDSIFYTIREGKLAMTSPWSFPLAYGADGHKENGYNEEYLDTESTDALVIGTTDKVRHPYYLFVELCKKDWFMELVCERWTQLRQTQGDALTAAAESIRTISENNVRNFVDDYQLYPTFHADRWTYSFEETYVSQQPHAENLYRWITERYEKLDDLLVFSAE